MPENLRATFTLMPWEQLQDFVDCLRSPWHLFLSFLPEAPISMSGTVGFVYLAVCEEVNRSNSLVGSFGEILCSSREKE